jgi:hypothetical protein
MPAPDLILRNAIAAQLASLEEEEEFSRPFTAAHGHLPRYKLEEIADTIRVVVAVGGRSRQILNRSETDNEIRIHIGVLKALATGQGVRSSDLDTLDELDQLIDLVHEIEQHFFPDDPRTTPIIEAGGLAFQCTQSVTDPPYSQEHLEQHRQFTGVLQLTFDVTT